MFRRDVDSFPRRISGTSRHRKLAKVMPKFSVNRSVTHPQIAPSQARLTLEFFEDKLPKKELVDMSILSILLSSGDRKSVV